MKIFCTGSLDAKIGYFPSVPGLQIYSSFTDFIKPGIKIRMHHSTIQEVFSIWYNNKSCNISKSYLCYSVYLQKVIFGSYLILVISSLDRLKNCTGYTFAQLCQVVNRRSLMITPDFDLLRVYLFQIGSESGSGM